MRYLGILLLFLALSCKQDDCAPNSSLTLSLKPVLRNYFPYSSGQKIKFAKYIDTVYKGDYLFEVDSNWFYTLEESYSHDCRGGMGQSIDKIYTEYLEISLLNLTQNNQHAKITFTGKYKEGRYPDNADPTELSIQFAGKSFVAYYFGDVIEKPESFPIYISNIEVMGKNYGPGFCFERYIDPYFPKDMLRLYFNSTHGILKYENEETKEKYFYKE